MVRTGLFLIALALLTACAEIAPLGGGEQDIYAAKPVAGSQHPAQGELRVSGNQLSVKFDEYFTLNDPSNTVVMNPTAGKVTVTAKKKDLIITWDSILQSNTTYIIQLNGTIRDLNEKNDTIHQFVFSTGDYLDSLKLNGVVSDAYSNKPLAACVVGLYAMTENPFTAKPRYVCQSNVNGKFDFTHLKPGSYQLFAYQDKNKDRIPGTTEYIGFSSLPIKVGDTMPKYVKLFVQKDTVQQLKIKLLSPAAVLVYGKNFNEHPVTINGKSVEIIDQVESDSMIVSLPKPEKDYLTVIAENDTVVKQFSEKERLKHFNLKSEVFKNSWFYGDTLTFTSQALFSAIDTSKIKCFDSKKNRIDCEVMVQKNSLLVVPKTQTIYDLELELGRGAVQESFTSNDSVRITFKTLKESDFSNLHLDVSSLMGNWQVQLIENQRVVKELPKHESDSLLTFPKLIPANYSVRCIEDVNKNGKWDIGSWTLKQQPERIERFELKTKLRPNWDVEETLTLPK